MAKYVAWLRGVNVGGNHTVNMQDLCKKLSVKGKQTVTNYGNSGNLLIESSASQDEITKAIEKATHKRVGKTIIVMLTTAAELEAIVRKDPFKNRDSPHLKTSITFTWHPLPITAKDVPIKNPEKDVDIIAIHGRAVFSLSYLNKGRYGMPHPFIESTYKISATTRTWNVVKKVNELLKNGLR
ncbi:DUF1697 domain-containing protein [Candidatus Woesearchaeota archaeon]|nr:DUF1697 domain-containing protein [Candidatus Woesearchaeota archaeon]